MCTYFTKIKLNDNIYFEGCRGGGFMFISCRPPIIFFLSFVGRAKVFSIENDVYAYINTVNRTQPEPVVNPLTFKICLTSLRITEACPEFN